MPNLPGLSLRDAELLFNLSLQCNGHLISHGIRPIVFEILDDETDEEEATKRQIDEQIKKEKAAIFQETVNQAQREAETESPHGFDPDEVDFGDDQDEDVDVLEKDDDDDDVVMEVGEMRKMRKMRINKRKQTQNLRSWDDFRNGHTIWTLLARRSPQRDWSIVMQTKLRPKSSTMASWPIFCCSAIITTIE